MTDTGAVRKAAPKTHRLPWDTSTTSQAAQAEHLSAAGFADSPHDLHHSFDNNGEKPRWIQPAKRWAVWMVEQSCWQTQSQSESVRSMHVLGPDRYLIANFHL